MCVYVDKHSSISFFRLKFYKLLEKATFYSCSYSVYVWRSISYSSFIKFSSLSYNSTFFLLLTFDASVRRYSHPTRIHYMASCTTYKKSLDCMMCDGFVLDGLIIDNDDDRFYMWKKKKKTIFTLSIYRSHHSMFFLSIYRSCLDAITIFIFRTTFFGKMYLYIIDTYEIVYLNL